jgi:hypothetical protein
MMCGIICPFLGYFNHRNISEETNMSIDDIQDENSVLICSDRP